MLYVSFGLLILLITTYSIYNRRNGVNVLMYHKISTQYTDFVTVNTTQLEAQMQYLKDNNFQVLPLYALTEAIAKGQKLPSKTVFITFDDGYVSNKELAQSILKKFNFTATIFLPTAYIGQQSIWEDKPADIMSLEELKTLDKSVFSFALHSHSHQNYKQISLQDIQSDLKKNIDFFVKNNINFVPAFAYPYGGRPKSKSNANQMKNIMKNLGILAAFRIGNRVNKFPLKDAYEVQRIDVRGEDTLASFARKLNGLAKII